MIDTVSTYQPVPLMLLSDPQRQRNWMVWPEAAAGRIDHRSDEPAGIAAPSLPPAERIVVRLLSVESYPPLTKLPPAARMSVHDAGSNLDFQDAAVGPD